MDVKLLCAADLHLGRRPSRIPAHLAGAVSSHTGWENLVERAVAEGVDAVLLGGDVIDQFNRSFEAYGPLERGIGRLAAAGIPVVAVAGNHDFDTLHDVAKEIGEDRLVVLSRGGEWQRWTLAGTDGEARLHVDGWSFPARYVYSDPASEYAQEPAGSVPVVGLLHCDLDLPESSYAPVASAALRRHPVQAWILGHIHAQRLDQPPGTAPILYPGSLQALDPGEPGAHGAWILELRGTTERLFRAVPLSPVRYATIDISIDGIDEPGRLNARVRSELTSRLDAFAEAGGACLRIAHCRVRLTGRTTLHGEIREILSGLEEFDPPTSSGVALSIDARPLIDTRPALDLQSLAGAGDAAGLLAELLLSLDESDELTPDPDLLEEASRAAESVAGRSHYQQFDLPTVNLDQDGPTLRGMLRRQAGRLLDHLVASREER